MRVRGTHFSEIRHQNTHFSEIRHRAQMPEIRHRPKRSRPSGAAAYPAQMSSTPAASSSARALSLTCVSVITARSFSPKASGTVP